VTKEVFLCIFMGCKVGRRGYEGCPFQVRVLWGKVTEVSRDYVKWKVVLRKFLTVLWIGEWWWKCFDMDRKEGSVIA
jgi:hypothetical protein